MGRSELPIGWHTRMMSRQTGTWFKDIIESAVPYFSLIKFLERVSDEEGNPRDEVKTKLAGMCRLLPIRAAKWGVTSPA